MLLIFLILTLFVLNVLWQTVSSNLLGTSNFELQSEDQFSLLYTKDHEKCESSSFSKVEVTLFMASNLRNGKRYLSTRSSDEINYSLSYQQQHIPSNNLHNADNPNPSWWIFQNETFNDLTPTWCLFKDKDLSYSLTLTHNNNINIVDKKQQKLASIVGVLLCGEYFVSLNQKYEINYDMLTLCQTYSQHKSSNKFVNDNISLKPLSNSNNVLIKTSEDNFNSYFDLRSLSKLTTAVTVTNIQSSVNYFIHSFIEFIRSSIPPSFFSSNRGGGVNSNNKLRHPSPMPTSLPTSLPTFFPSPQPSSQPSSMPTR